MKMLLLLLVVTSAGLASESWVDRVVEAELARRGVEPAPLCSDATFLRRVYLDVIGTIPTPQEVQAFAQDQSQDKREQVIDDLLQREAFATYQALRWGDILRIKAEFPSKLWPHAVQAYHRWIKTAIRDGMPYSDFARELLTASGSNFRVPPVNFYRANPQRSPEGFATDAALIFFGRRLDAAALGAAPGFVAAFGCIGFKPTDEWKEEIVFFDRRAYLTRYPPGEAPRLSTLEGEPVPLQHGVDPRRAIATAIIGDPAFDRAFVNRVWFWLLGRGIVEEVDDLRPDNPAWSPALLELLAHHFRESGHDYRQPFRAILSSKTYQRASTTETADPACAGFAFYHARRLEAEVLLDVINQLTASGERYMSMIPEPFTFLPYKMHAVELADGSIELPFLTIFGRPARNTSFASERDNQPALPQAQHLLNSSHIQEKIERAQALKKLVTRVPKGMNPRQHRQHIAKQLSIAILSRLPTDHERIRAVAYLEDPARPLMQSAQDLAWALMNTKEFILKH